MPGVDVRSCRWAVAAAEEMMMQKGNLGPMSMLLAHTQNVDVCRVILKQMLSHWAS